MHRLRTVAAVEWLLGLTLVAVLTFAGYHTWRFYERELRPQARKVDTQALTHPRVVRADDPAAVRRFQDALDLMGEATGYFTAKRYDWARASVERALALDPGNPDALALLAQLDRMPEPALTPEEAEALRRSDRVMELLGAADAFRIAGDRANMRRALQEAATLEPHNAVVAAALAGLGAAGAPN